MSPVRRHVITGPDIDKLADGIYGPELDALTIRIVDLTQAHADLKAENRRLRRELRGVAASRDAVLHNSAIAKVARKRLVTQNARLKAQLLNHGIAIPEDES